jgi:uncharacterized cupin superfamily protein
VTVNLLEVEPGPVGALVGGELLGMSVYDVRPGEASSSYHYEVGREEWLIVLSGHPTVRTPEGELGLDPWDTLLFPEGAAGAHQVVNRTAETVRVAIWSTKQVPNATVYPDDDRIYLRPQGLLFRLSDALDAWDAGSPGTP